MQFQYHRDEHGHKADGNRELAAWESCYLEYWRHNIQILLLSYFADN
jgi:hypothetical protein